MAKKILIVDDEKDLVTLLKERISQAGYEVIAAYDGVEGLKLAKENKPDLIILDLMLPKMDGYMVCSLLKFDSEYKNIPIILLTARAGDSDKTKGVQAGADLYITKPFEPKALLESISKLLTGAQ